MPHVTLGDKVKDSITQFEGIAVCRSEWLHGCVRINVLSEVLDKDNKFVEHNFDEAQLEIIEHGAKAPKLYNEPRPPGGPNRYEEKSSHRR